MSRKLGTGGLRLSAVLDLGLMPQIQLHDADARQFDAYDPAKPSGERVGMEGIGRVAQVVVEPTVATDARSTKSLSLSARALDRGSHYPS